MTPAAQHPALVAAVEVLRPVLREVTSRYGQSYREPDYNPAAHLEITITVDEARKALTALALFRAAMEKAETMYLPIEGRGDYFKGLLITEQGRALCDTMPVERVTVLRWEE